MEGESNTENQLLGMRGKKIIPSLLSEFWVKSHLFKSLSSHALESSLRPWDYKATLGTFSGRSRAEFHQFLKKYQYHGSDHFV